MARRDDARRDLIFGLLALQNRMITRDQVVAAFAVGTASGRPMAELLVEQGALLTHRREVLDALAAEHLALHGDDPELSLAAIESLPTIGGTTIATAGPGGGPERAAPAAPEVDTRSHSMNGNQPTHGFIDSMSRVMTDQAFRDQLLADPDGTRANLGLAPSDRDYIAKIARDNPDRISAAVDDRWGVIVATRGVFVAKHCLNP